MIHECLHCPMADESDLPIECPHCGGSGIPMVCCDDLCRGQGYCIYGDGNGEEMCPACNGSCEA